ncbi:hypothetical protein B0A49_09921 [Cryomyces minteri]|uniref:Uncharacterized protein n=1 Tax=Cryomyces minteri TaxID=331657 RepID=A0A4U0WLV6_9PEZI|nr:hypothetical protein B0A49_09921 [Cryomyces minteri]
MLRTQQTTERLEEEAAAFLWLLAHTDIDSSGRLHLEPQSSPLDSYSPSKKSQLFIYTRRCLGYGDVLDAANTYPDTLADIDDAHSRTVSQVTS